MPGVVAAQLQLGLFLLSPGSATAGVTLSYNPVTPSSGWGLCDEQLKQVVPLGSLRLPRHQSRGPAAQGHTCVRF